VYRVNQEYVDLYSTRQQDTRDLNEYFRGDPRNDGWMKWDPEADDES